MATNTGSNNFSTESTRDRVSRQINLVAIGRTGDGKSSTLNSILAHSNLSSTAVPFEACHGPNSVTKVISHRFAEVLGVECRLIDTMGLFDTDLTPETVASASIYNVSDMDKDQKVVLSELSKVVHLCSDGIDAFLFVLSGFGRFTRESKDTIRIILRFFGNDLLDHCIFILTNKDRIHSDHDLTAIKLEISKFLTSCGCKAPDESQFVAFDNLTKPHPIDQVVLLMGAITVLRDRHANQPYKNAAFQLAQRELKEEKIKLERQKQRQMDELVRRETDKVAKLYREQNEKAQREIERREREKFATKEAQMESQRKIDRMLLQMQFDMEKVERDSKERIKAAQLEAKKLRDEEIRKLQESISEKAAANERIARELQAEIRKNSSRKCSVM